MDDVLLTSAFTGLPTSMLRPSLAAAGLDPDAIPEALSRATAAQVHGGAAPPPARWRDLWSAGHSVSGVDAVLPVAQLVARIVTEFHAAASPQGRALPGTAP
jgi:nitronate monooxygenase